MSQPNRRKPFADKSPIASPPAVDRGEPVRVPPVLKPSMTKEQLEQARAYASDRPLHRPARPDSVEPLIRDPERLAEVRARLMGEEEKAPVSSFLLDFGRVLKAERERQGLSLSDVSERCGVEKGAISRLENGLNANPTVDTIRRCAHALGKAITLRLTDEAGSTASPIQTDSASPTEELIPTRGPTDRRNWSMLLAKSMFWISIIEALENSCGGDAAIGLEVPADVRSDFADLFTSCSKWMAREGQRAGPTPGDEL